MRALVLVLLAGCTSDPAFWVDDPGVACAETSGNNVVVTIKDVCFPVQSYSRGLTCTVYPYGWDLVVRAQSTFRMPQGSINLGAEDLEGEIECEQAQTRCQTWVPNGRWTLRYGANADWLDVPGDGLEVCVDPVYRPENLPEGDTGL